MRLKIAIVGAVVAASLAPLTARATPIPLVYDCVTYSVTAPVIGTKSGNVCVPGGTNHFSVGHSTTSCGGVPPAGVSHCVTILIWLPV